MTMKETVLALERNRLVNYNQFLELQRKCQGCSSAGRVLAGCPGFDLQYSLHFGGRSRKTEVQGHSGLHSKLEDSLSYMRHCLKYIHIFSGVTIYLKIVFHAEREIQCV